MTDLSAYSDAELMAIAGGGSSTDLSGYSNDELMQIAGVQPKTQPSSMWESIAGKGYAPPGSIGEALSNFGSNIFNKDVWFGRPSGEVIEPAQAIAGPAAKTLQGLTLGFGDEIAAGSNSIIDYLTGNPTTYDQRLSDARGVQQNFEKASPVVAGGMELAGALKVPNLNLAGKLSKVLPKSETISQALLKTGALGAALAGEGALYGGLTGFGTGEGDNRIESAKEGASLGGLVGGVLGTPLAGVGEIATVYSDEINNLAKKFLRRSTGARASDYSKTAKELGYWDIADDEVKTATTEALDALENQGVFGGSNREPSTMLANVLKEEKKTSTTIDRLLRTAEKSGVKNHPDFENALNYLAEGKVQADEVEKYLEKLEKLSDDIKIQGKGRPTYLQQQKIAVGSKYNPDDGAANGFWRAVYTDIQKSVEEVAPEVGELNSHLRDLKLAKPIFQRGIGSQESKNWVDALFERIRTSGAKTMAGPAVAAAAMFGGGAGLPAAIAAGGLGHLATSKGRVQFANALKKIAGNSGKPISYLEGRIPALANLAGKSHPLETQGNEAQRKTEISHMQSEPSFNSKLDQVVNQQIDKSMKTPEIIEVKRINSDPADAFLSEVEGGQQLKAYDPPAKGSGATVATGFDLGQWSEDDLINAGVSKSTVNKVSKYLGKKDASARLLLKEQPLKLTKEQANELDEAAKSDIFGTIEAKLKNEGINLSKLPQEAQTVIKSISYNFGKNIDQKLPTIWKAIVDKDWASVKDLLINTKWKQPELLARRQKEADLLSRIA